jgi:hypothetical protein
LFRTYLHGGYVPVSPERSGPILSICPILA